MKDFSSGSIPKHLLSFFIPLFLANTMQAIYMMIDAIWAGHLLGPSGVAIVSTGTPVIFFLSSLIAGVVLGAAILVGQAYGAHDFKRISNIISTSFIATIVISVFVTLIGVVGSGFILHIINTPPEIYSGAKWFLIIICAGIVFSMLVMWFASVMNAVGDSKTPMKILLLTLLINAVLAPLLILGVGILPKLGVAGSAVSTVFANIIGVFLCFLTWRKHRLSKMSPIRIEFHKDTVKKIFAVGFPLSLQLIVVSSSFLFILSLVNAFGPIATAAFGIGSRVDQFAFMASFAVGTAISAMTAQNIGACKTERVTEILHWGLVITVLIAIIFAVTVFSFSGKIVLLFTNDPGVAVIARPYFLVAGFTYIVFSILFAFQGVFRGAGATVSSLIIVSFTMIFLRVPLCYFLSHIAQLKELGLWLGIAASTSVGAFIFWIYYLKGTWLKSKKKVSVEECEIEVAPMHD